MSVRTRPGRADDRVGAALVAAADGDAPPAGRRDGVETALLGALLAGPAVLAFASGGFFDRPRVIALIVAWAGVLVAALAARRPVPAGGPAVVAVAALAGLAVWTMVATRWAPLTGPAIDDAQRLLLYLAVLVLACALARGERRRLVVPGLAAGALVVVAYALAGRLLPALVPQTQTATGFGRLEQPLTYWNALGLLAAFGTVLWVGLAADATRPRPLRTLAPAAGVVLVLGASLTFSRGALAVLGAGLVALAVLAPTRAAVRAAAVVVVAGVAASAVAGLFDGVRAAEGGTGTRTVQGLVVLAVLAALAGAAVAAGRWIRAADAGPAARPARPSGAGAVVRAGAAVLAGAAAVAVLVLVTGGAPRTATPETGADARRLASLSTNRYEYWQVAAQGFAAAPLRGEGPASFRVRWLREREVDERVVDAHSLPVETATELGLVGLALLLALGGAVVAGARRARDPVAAAALAAFALHACLDWDWEMPAVTLPALVLAGTVLVAREPPAPRRGLAAAGRGLLAVLAVAVLATTPSALREADRLADVDAELDRPGRDLAAVEARLRGGIGARGTDAEVRLAEFFIFSGRPARAVPLLEQVVRREPENAAAWRDLRVALQELGDPRAGAALARERALTGAGRLR